MKTKKILIGLALVTGIVLSSCQNQTKAKLTNEADSVSYALGINIGSSYAQNLVEFPGELNKDALIKGFIKGFAEDTLNYQISQDSIIPILQAFIEKDAAKKREEAELKNTQILFENRKLDGVQVTSSGLQYKIIEEGKGKIPAKEDIVRVHYIGTLSDGIEFDNSIKRGQPVDFSAGGVIPGFAEALTMMPVGSKWQIVIPSELGYGEYPPPGSNIPANSVLFFDVQLLEIVPQK